MSSMIGTGFVGDAQRRRVLSSSSSASGTPPSSPGLPRSPPPSSLGVLTETNTPSVLEPTSPISSEPPEVEGDDESEELESSSEPESSAPTPAPVRPPPRGSSFIPPPASLPEGPPPQPPPEMDPLLSLQLRLRWLEALLLGVKVDNPRERRQREKELAAGGVALIRRAEGVQQKLDEIVNDNEGLKRFMEHYDQYAHLLSPSFALSGTVPPSSSTYAYENMDATALEALLSEMELDIRAADRDMREIANLESKGVLEAGNLVLHEGLKERLDALVLRRQEDEQTAKELEKRVGKVLRKYATQVDALSELFVEWNDVLTEAEDKVLRLEREREERRRLGF